MNNQKRIFPLPFLKQIINDIPGHYLWPVVITDHLVTDETGHHEVLPSALNYRFINTLVSILSTYAYACDTRTERGINILFAQVQALRCLRCFYK